MKLLYIEDEPKMARLIKRTLEQAGYEVDTEADGADGYARARSNEYDLVIVDDMLPSMSGREVCKALRGEGFATPLLMLTARKASYDIVDSLNAGADDYVTKPFDVDELKARIRVLLRRSSTYSDVMRIDDVELNVRTREIRKGAKSLPVTDREFRLLEYLMRNSGRAISRADITMDVWAIPFDPQTNLVDVVINHLRAKIDSPGRESFIKTIRGIGYRVG